MRSLFSGVIPLFVLAHLAHHLVTALLVPLLPFIRDEFALDYTRAGFVIATFGVVYGASQLPAGWLADRLGHRVLLTISIVGVAVTGLLVGVSQNYIMLIISFVLMGILGGGYHPASTTMISAAIEAKSRGRALGFHMVGGGASYFLAPLIAAGIAVAWGWRGPFIGLAIPSIAFGILLHVLLGRRMPAKEAELKTASSYVEAPPSPDHRRRLVTILILSTLVQAGLISTVSFIPLFLVDNFGAGREVAAASMSLVYAMGLWAGPLGGYFSDRLGRVPMILAMCFLAGPVIYLLNLAPYSWGTVALLIIIGITMYVTTTVSQAYIVDQASERHRSTILGIYFFGTMEGAGVLPPAIGYLIDQFGFYPSFTIIGAALLAVALTSSLVLVFSRD